MESVITAGKHHGRVGKRSQSGHIYKGVGVGRSSIPSKYQLYVSTNSDRAGFTSTTKRFQELLDENPGPGAYDTATNKPNTSASMSAKGYGPLASSSARSSNSALQKLKELPGPSNYDTNISSFSTNKFLLGNTRTFAQPIATNVENRKIELFKTPGPADYNTVIHSEHPFEKKGTSAFKSTAKRQTFSSTNGKRPGPGYYEEPKCDVYKKSTTTAAQSAFVSTSKRLQTFDTSKALGPGPAAYQSQSGVDQTQPIGGFQLPRKHYLCFSAPAIPPSPPPPMPGPGHYNPDTRDAERDAKKHMSGSSFVSNTTRWQTIASAKKREPGPGYYEPVLPSVKQSFFFNTGKAWVPS